MSPDTDDDRLFSLYNKRLIELSAQAQESRHLAHVDAKAHAVSPICGSKVDVELQLTDGKVSDFGFAVESCALTKTVVAIMRRAIIGKTRQDIRKAGMALEAMLSGASVTFDDGWQDLDILLPVRDYKARHNAILLPFEAVERAFNHDEPRQEFST